MALFRKLTIAFLLLSGAVFPPLGFSEEIHGKITVPPPYPQPKTIKAEKKFKDNCADELISPSLLVSEQGALSNVVVWLEGDFGKTDSVTVKKQAVLDQNQCGYSPHVFLVDSKTPFLVQNSDPLAHDVRAFDGAEMIFRFEMESGAKAVEKDFHHPGIYVLRCGLHPWMYAFGVKMAHPFYAVSDPAGEFSIKGIPEGDYQLHLWHETLGTHVVSVKVGPGITPLEYVFKKA